MVVMILAVLFFFVTAYLDNDDSTNALSLFVTPTHSPTISPSPSPKPSNGILGESTSTVSAYVERVVDGDTIRVLIQDQPFTVRLIGVNTPETVDPRKEVECYGKEASNKLKEIIGGKQVYLEIDDSQSNKDRYGRLLRYVYLNSILVNEQLIREGYAYEYTYGKPYKYQQQFRTAQEEAQNIGIGLWDPAICPQS